MVSKSGKRVLVIAYYWPPSGGSGVQRWVKFVKYLHRLGWEPVVYTPENPEYPSIDQSMLKDIPRGIEVIKTKIWEPFNIYKKLANKNKAEKINTGFLSEDGKKSSTIQNLSVWVRGNFFIPDARKFWIKPSIKYLNNYLKKNPVDYVVSTGPPHSMHMIALGVKKENQVHWVADFRDPWTNIDFYSELKLTKAADKKHHRLEKKVLQTADLTITVGETMKKEFEAIGAKKVVVITNGYDADDIPEEIIPKDEKFTIAHIGSLNQSRNPKVLWEALAELFEEQPKLKTKIEIKLVGKVDIHVKQSIEKAGLTEHVKRIPYLQHEEAIKEQLKSHLLLLLVNNTPNAKGILTGKMFEYMSARTPILGIGPVDGDAAKVLEETKAGKMIDYADKAQLKKFIEQVIAGGFDLENSSIEQYSREQLTVKLIEEFDKFWG